MDVQQNLSTDQQAPRSAPQIEALVGASQQRRQRPSRRQLSCSHCGISCWCDVSKGDTGNLLERWAEREPWQQVAHIDPLLPNPIVDEDTREQDRRLRSRRADGRQLFAANEPQPAVNKHLGMDLPRLCSFGMVRISPRRSPLGDKNPAMSEPSCIRECRYRSGLHRVRARLRDCLRTAPVFEIA